MARASTLSTALADAAEVVLDGGPVAPLLVRAHLVAGGARELPDLHPPELSPHPRKGARWE